jgi:CRP-like cAMP-binding protein
MSIDERVALLATASLFEHVSHHTLRELAAAMEIEEYPPDTTIIREGDPGHHLYVVAEGNVEVTTQNGQVFLARAGRGAVIGELALISPDSRRQASVRSLTRLTVLSLSRESFEAFLHAHPIAERLLRRARRMKLLAKFLRVHILYRLSFQDPRRERLFLASIAFLLSFGSVRGITLAIRAGRGPFRNVAFGERHIHHLVWGILLLLLIGYAWLVQLGTGVGQDRRLMRSTAMLYGLGSALTLDEFALWLNLEDVYWSEQGRASIDAVILFGSLLSVGIWGGPFWRLLFRLIRAR